MDFGGIEPWLRSLAFFGILAGAALVAWWVLNVETTGNLRQLAAAVAALATIPAAIVAPMQDGAALTILGLVSVAGFVAAAAAAATPILQARRTAVSPSQAPAAAVSAPTTVGPSQTRVASYAAVTEARPAPASEHTVALGPKPNMSEIAFLIDYSGDGHPFRLTADNRIGRDPAAEVTLEDDGASREHSRIKLEDGRFVLYDLGSKNGTRLVRAGRRRKLGAPSPLQDLDIIEIGQSRLVFINVELQPNEPRA